MIIFPTCTTYLRVISYVANILISSAKHYSKPLMTKLESGTKKTKLFLAQWLRTRIVMKNHSREVPQEIKGKLFKHEISKACVNFSPT